LLPLPAWGPRLAGPEPAANLGNADSHSRAGELDRTFKRRDTVAAEIEEVFLTHRFGELLSTLPGIGPRTGSRIWAEIGDGTRFVDRAKLASYAGLAPMTRQSGKSINRESKSRRGNHRLKNAMFLAAFASLRAPESTAFYDRERAEAKKHNAVIICLARRRCDVILAMLRTNHPYLTADHRAVSVPTEKGA
jgi:transposase